MKESTRSSRILPTSGSIQANHGRKVCSTTCYTSSCRHCHNKQTCPMWAWDCFALTNHEGVCVLNHGLRVPPQCHPGNKASKKGTLRFFGLLFWNIFVTCRKILHKNDQQFLKMITYGWQKTYFSDDGFEKTSNPKDHWTVQWKGN